MIDERIKELLNPSVLNTVSGLELIARVIVEGFMSGSNKSQSVGVGQEFSQYKNYQPGDDLRQLDWKMFARSGRYYIKEAEIETNITVKFMLDASRSMAYAEDGLSKLQFAKVMMAALAYLARRQSDTFGLFAVNDKQIKALLPRFEQQQFMRFLLELISIESEGKWESSGSEERLFDHHGKEMIVFFTDMYDADGDLLRFISRLKTSRNEVVIFHLVGKQERDLAYEGSLTFEDLETKVRTKVNTVMQRKEYAARVASWLQDTRMWMLERDISYHVVTLQDGAENVLQNFLITRSRLVR
ncbi:MAG: DUF58 domain-containing protein [Cyclobacteriaceae bacterium]|nr:DUF58 domain-containing protein [Cyclobacteriaceae bacterium]